MVRLARRPQLRKDLLVIPSTLLEAMGLVALEAQACGLPVLYQPVPGLNEILASSGVATDFTHSAALARDRPRSAARPPAGGLRERCSLSALDDRPSSGRPRRPAHMNTARPGNSLVQLSADAPIDRQALQLG